jgi:hypothetical protein
MASTARTIRRKKQPTRAQALRATAETQRAMTETRDAQIKLFQLANAMYRKAVSVYFGRDLPTDLQELLQQALSAGIQKAVASAEPLDITAEVTQLVTDFMAAEADVTSGDAATAQATADLAADDLMVQTEQAFAETFGGGNA